MRVLFLALILSLSASALAAPHVVHHGYYHPHGYYHGGTYVAPHLRSWDHRYYDPRWGHFGVYGFEWDVGLVVSTPTEVCVGEPHGLYLCRCRNLMRERAYWWSVDRERFELETNQEMDDLYGSMFSEEVEPDPTVIVPGPVVVYRPWCWF